MTPTIIGEHPLARDENGKLKSRIGALFPYENTLVTLPGIHATQRLAYLEILDEKRQAAGLAPLTREEQTALWENSVDLVMEDDAVLIRPDPEKMPLAFTADEILQQLVPKHRIRFLYPFNAKVRDAIKRRGECWRINPLPKSADEMKQMIAASRIGIGGKEIYYFNKATGTRLLTYHEFARLDALDDADRRRHLAEIREFSARFSAQGNPEIDFFMADESFSKADLAAVDFHNLSPDELQTVYRKLRQKFHDAVPAKYRRDDPDDVEWRNRMCGSLIGQEGEVVSEETLLGLSPEFFMQIQWLPGGRIEEGELIFDPVFDESSKGVDDPELARLRDENCRGFIFNFVREHGDLEYVNVGRVVNSLSQRPASAGRRDVYIAEVKQRQSGREIVSIIRMQKWGVREHLDEGKTLADAIIQSEEYTEYVLDRRLGCRQLGMNLPTRVTAKRISERYCGNRKEYKGVAIWTPYFERDYVRGIATDKIPNHRFEDDAFALVFARLLGRAAAPNLIVGRSDLHGYVLFDDGDEVVVEDESGTPVEIIVTDLTGTFADYRSELPSLAAVYADPINRRIEFVSRRQDFASAYLDAFARRFSSIQQEYRKRKRAFDTLFGHRPRDEAGSIAYRWEKVLDRLNRADPNQLAELVRKNMTVGQISKSAATK